MVGEWKVGTVDRAVDSFMMAIELRQDPHSAPAPFGRLEKDFVLPDQESVTFDQVLGPRTRALDWQRRWIFGGTKFFDRTDFAFWAARRTNRGAEIQKRGIVICGQCARHERSRVIPKRVLAGRGIDRLSQIKEAAQYSRNIRFDDRHRSIEREGCNRMGGVLANPRKILHFADLPWKSTAMAIDDDFRGGVEISGASVVAEALPGVEHIVLRRARQGRKTREPAQPLFIIGEHGSDLGLLKHQFGNEDGVRIAGPPPRKVAAVLGAPAKES